MFVQTLVPTTLNAGLIWALGIALTMIWALGLRARFSKTVGFIGGLASVPAILCVLFLLCLFSYRLAIGVARGIPLFGSVLIYVMPLILLIVAFWLLTPCVSGLLGFLNYIFRLIQQGGSISVIVFGGFCIALVVNAPSLNEQFHHVPMILSGLLGLYTVIFVRDKWRNITREVAINYAMEYGNLPYFVRESEIGREVMTAALERLESQPTISGQQLTAVVQDEVDRRDRERHQAYLQAERDARKEAIKRDIRTYLESPLASTQRLQADVGEE